MNNPSKCLPARQVFSRKIQIFSILAAEWDLNSSHRSTCLALISLSNGSPKFKAYYKEISEQIFKRDDLAAYEEAKQDKFSPYSTQAVKRRLQSLEDHGRKIGIPLLTWTHGAKKTDSYTSKSEFKFFFLDYINSLFDDVTHRQIDKRREIQKVAFDFAFEKLVEAKPQEVENPQRRKPKRVSKESLAKAAERLDSIDQIEEMTEMMTHYQEVSEYYRSLARAANDKLLAMEKILAEKNKIATSCKTGGGDLDPKTATKPKAENVVPSSIRKSDKNESRVIRIAHYKDIRVKSITNVKCSSWNEKRSCSQLYFTFFDSFVQIGIDRFEVSLVTPKKKFVKFETISGSDREKIAFYATLANKDRLNLYVRPISKDIELIMIDDVCPAFKEDIEKAAFLIMETSKDNFQAWFAIRGKQKNRKSILKKMIDRYMGDPASPGINSRLPGTYNFKEKHGPNFPRVKLISMTRENILEENELLKMGFSKKEPDNKPVRRTENVACYEQKKRTWPDYYRALAEAPKKNNGESDRSSADLRYATIAIKKGFTSGEVAEKLYEVSEKAGSRNMSYSHNRVKRAIAYLEEGGI